MNKIITLKPLNSPRISVPVFPISSFGKSQMRLTNVSPVLSTRRLLGTTDVLGTKE